MRFFPAFALCCLVSLMLTTFVGTAPVEAIDNDGARATGLYSVHQATAAWCRSRSGWKLKVA
jgi:hypothetical protein